MVRKKGGRKSGRRPKKGGRNNSPSTFPIG